MKQNIPAYFGEFFGTFILVFFGTVSVAMGVLFNAPVGLVQVALVWGMGVTLAIYATRHLSCAHLNPAVSLGMVLTGRMNKKLLVPYCISQLSGGIFAGLLVLIIFNSSLVNFEQINHITRGNIESVKTAMIFGEYFPNPAFDLKWFEVSIPTAMLVELIGTFLLVTMIFLLTEDCNIGKPTNGSAPIFIGVTVSALIATTAPFTQTGINPARDFGPRIVAFFAGWNTIAIPGPRGGFFVVYILAPLIGSICAAILFKYIIEPLMRSKKQILTCGLSS